MMIAGAEDQQRESRSSESPHARGLFHRRRLRGPPGRLQLAAGCAARVLPTLAEANRISVVRCPQPRLDPRRNGEVLARTTPPTPLEITPSKVADVERPIDELSMLVDRDPARPAAASRSSRRRARLRKLPIRRRLTERRSRASREPLPFPGSRSRRALPLVSAGEVASTHRLIGRSTTPT